MARFPTPAAAPSARSYQPGGAEIDPRRAPALLPLLSCSIPVRHGLGRRAPEIASPDRRGVRENARVVSPPSLAVTTSVGGILVGAFSRTPLRTACLPL